jgi:4-oxalocrotonate tautomerase
MPLIEVTITPAPHRTPELKRALISALTSAVVDLGVAPKESVRVILREVPAEHFAAGDVTLAERRAAQAAASASENEKGNVAP